MRFLKVVAIATFGICANSAGADPISSAEELNSLVVGKTLENKRGHTIIMLADGGFDGNVGGNKPIGRWDWRDGQFCRELTIGSREFPYQCQVVEVDGSSVTFKRADGSMTEWTMN